MDFKKLILSYYKSDYKYHNVYAAYELGYLSETLDYYVNKFKGQLKSFIDNNTEYELSVKLITKGILDYHSKEHYVSIKVRPNMTYGELFRAVIKKCREIKNLADDSVLIRDEYMWINDTKYEEFDDFVALANNNNNIKLDIKDLQFYYWIDDSGCDRNDDEYIFWKELNKTYKDEKIEPVEDDQVEDDQVEEKQKEEIQTEEKLVEEKPVERKPVEKNLEENIQKHVEQQNKKQKEEYKKQKNGGCCAF